MALYSNARTMDRQGCTRVILLGRLRVEVPPKTSSTHLGRICRVSRLRFALLAPKKREHIDPAVENKMLPFKTKRANRGKSNKHNKQPKHQTKKQTNKQTNKTIKPKSEKTSFQHMEDLAGERRRPRRWDSRWRPEGPLKPGDRPGQKPHKSAFLSRDPCNIHLNIAL